LGESVSQEKLLMLLDHFGEAEGRLRWATDKKLQLDVALIKGIHLLGEASLSDVLDALNALRGGSPLPERTAPRPSVPTRPVAPSTAPAPVPTLKATPLPVAATPTAPVVPAKIESTPAPIAVVAPLPTESPVELVSSPTSTSNDPWQLVALKLAADSPLKFGWAEDGKFLERIGNAILVEFPPSLEQQTKTLFWPQAVKKIEEQLSGLLGDRITFEYRFTGEEPPAPPEPEPVPVQKAAAPKPRESKPSESAVKPPEPAAPQISAEELEAFKNDPLIKKALELFKAEILIDPPKTA
jgi:DNA polymerase-3 subunit gamma/tau